MSTDGTIDRCGACPGRGAGDCESCSAHVDAEPVAPPAAPIDAGLGESIDRLYGLREERRALERAHQAELEPIEAEEKALETRLIEEFSKAELDGAKGHRATASLRRETIATVRDWEAFCAWTADHRAWDMVQRRVNNAAYRSRLEEGVDVCGVEPYVVIKLGLTKR